MLLFQAAETPLLAVFAGLWSGWSVQCGDGGTGGADCTVEGVARMCVFPGDSTGKDKYDEGTAPDIHLSSPFPWPRLAGYVFAFLLNFRLY
jgi:hypothetical protein